MDLVSATTEITVHSIETVSGGGHGRQVQRGYHFMLILLYFRVFRSGARTTVYVRYDVDLSTHGRGSDGKHGTHAHTRTYTHADNVFDF